MAELLDSNVKWTSNRAVPRPCSPPKTVVGALRALRQCWRANGGLALDVGRARTAVRSLGAVLVPASGLAYALGYVTVAKFGKALRVSPDDLGLDAKDYILLTAVWVALLGAVLGLVFFGYLLCRPLAREFWVIRALHRHGLLYLSLLGVGGLMIVAREGLTLVVDQASAGALAGLASLVLLPVGLGALLALMVAIPGAGRCWSFLVLMVGFGAIAVAGLVSQADEASQFGRDVVQAAKERHDVGRTASMVALVIEPVQGRVELPDGGVQCVVRIAERVFLTVPDGETLVAPDRFVSSKACSP